VSDYDVNFVKWYEPAVVIITADIFGCMSVVNC